MHHEPMVLLSVRPRFAQALLDGTKTVEVRRRRARIPDGALCLLYESSPTCAIVGALRVESIDSAASDELWGRYGDQMGITRDEYDAYLAGAGQPCAIVVGAVTRFAHPVRLPELRRRQDRFVTPQSYRYLGEREVPSLLNGQMRELKALAALPASA